MHIRKLDLTQFKNHEQSSWSFSPNINCFVGKNGIGKTNILEAIHYLALAKSFSGTLDKHNIQFEQSFFMIQAEIQKEDSFDTLSVMVQTGKKKRLKKNDYEFPKITEFIGYLPLVLISPYDRDLISEGASSRRKYIDMILSQVDKNYLNALVKYNKLLQQRNSLLKYFASNHVFNPDQLEVYDAQMIAFAMEIAEKRQSYIGQVRVFFQEKYQQLAQNPSEQVDIRYESQVKEDFEKEFRKNILKDRLLQHTSMGIHRDDIILSINGGLVKRFGSQGQQKSLLIALKLAQYDYLKNTHKVDPVLLLDDVFDKLDDHRVQALIDLVNQDYFGQIFITDTHKDRMEHLLGHLKIEHQLFEIL